VGGKGEDQIRRTIDGMEKWNNKSVRPAGAMKISGRDRIVTTTAGDAPTV
jgi:hypothetical protein